MVSIFAGTVFTTFLKYLQPFSFCKKEEEGKEHSAQKFFQNLLNETNLKGLSRLLTYF